MTLRFSISRTCMLIISVLAFSITSCGRDVARRVTEIQDTFHVTGLAFSPDGALLATSSVGTNEVHIWSLSDTPPKAIKVLKQDPDTPAEAWALSYSQVDGLRFTGDGSRLLNAHNGGPGNHFRIMRIWSTASWTPIADVAEEKAGGGGFFPTQIAVSSDGKFAIRRRGAQLEAFDTDTGQLGVTHVRGGEPPITAATLSTDGSGLAIAFQTTVRIYDLGK